MTLPLQGFIDLHVVYCAGWGMPSHSGHLLERALSHRLSQFGVAQRPEQVRLHWHAHDLRSLPSTPLPADSPFVAIGHSTGFAALLAHVRSHTSGKEQALAPASDCVAWVSLHGFTRFCSSASQAEGTDPRVLRRMVQQFERDPQGVWQAFMQRSGSEAVETLQLRFEACHRTEDHMALEHLLTLNTDYNGTQAEQPPVLVLASEEDAIVPAALTHACFTHAPATQVHWLEPTRHAGHLQALADAGTTAEHIHRFLNQYADRIPH